MASRKKTFDCVEMKRRGADKVQRETQGMSREEELAWWSRGTAELLKLQQDLRQARAHPGSPDQHH